MNWGTLGSEATAEEIVQVPDALLHESKLMASFYGLEAPKLICTTTGRSGYDPENGVRLGLEFIEAMTNDVLRDFRGRVEPRNVHPNRLDRKVAVHEPVGNEEALSATILMFVFAHEWAHHLQARHYKWSKLLERVRLYEIQADILAGYWVARYAISLPESDRERFFLAAFNSGSADALDSHGDPQTRRDAAMFGLSVGSSALLNGVHATVIRKKEQKDLLTASLTKARELESRMTSEEDLKAPCLRHMPRSDGTVMLQWTSTSRTDLARYEIRRCIGDRYDAALATTVWAGKPLQNSHTLDLKDVAAGDCVTFKVFIVTVSGAEKDSNPVTARKSATRSEPR